MGNTPATSMRGKKALRRLNGETTRRCFGVTQKEPTSERGRSTSNEKHDGSNSVFSRSSRVIGVINNGDRTESLWTDRSVLDRGG